MDIKSVLHCMVDILLLISWLHILIGGCSYTKANEFDYFYERST